MTEDAVKRACKFFLSDYNCAQSTMKAILIASNSDFKQVTQLTAGFGGGIAHEGLVCGSVSGAIAAIGVVLGSSIKDVQEHKQATYEISEKFVKLFKEQHGTLLCNELTKIDMTNKSDREKALTEGIFFKICPAFVESAVRIALELLHEFQK